MKKSKIAVVSALALTLAGGVFYLSHIPRAPLPPIAPIALKSASEEPKMPNADGSAPVGPGPIAAYEDSDRPQTLVTKDVLAVLPGVHAELSDWRTYNPDSITIQPFPGVAMTFNRTQSRDEHGRIVWTGRNSVEGAFLVTTATEKQWVATMVVPDGDAIEVTIGAAGVSVKEKNDQDFDCGSDAVTHAPVSAKSVIEAANGVMAAADDYTTLRTVDVLFIYDAGVLTAFGTQQAIDTKIINLLESANQVLTSSAVTNLRWRFTASYEGPAYVRDNKFATDLGYLSSATHPLGVLAQNKAVLHGADQVVLLSSGEGDSSGLAYQPGHHSVVSFGPASSYFTLTHELGHNFGCRHDRIKELATDSNGVFAYGHNWDYFDPVFQQTLKRGTIMSYSSSVIPYFSNPDVSYQGTATGVVETAPKAANNARQLKEQAQAMEAYRAAVSMPAITTHPVNTTVTSGTSLTLTVSASGGSLLYQWSRNNVDIAGATNSSYTKTAAADDAGTYKVTVWNNVGSATSNNATVTINPAPAGGGNSGGGGGGGGGAPSLWFFAAIGGLAAIRRFLKS